MSGKVPPGIFPTTYETIDPTLEGTVIDPTGKIINQPLLGNPLIALEIASARGERGAIDERMSQTINAYGLPKSHRWGEWYLRETRQRLMLRSLGESTQLVVASIGDSWTHASTRYVGPTADYLKTTFGDAGPGWTGFAWGGGGASNAWSSGNGSASADIAVTLSANWTCAYYTSNGPDLGQIATSTAAASVSVAYTGSGDTSAAVLYYVAGAGVVRYRWNAGSWTTLDLTSGSVVSTATLAGMPSGTWTLDIENVSGTTTLCGVDIQKSGSGVRWHKLGATGSASSNWTNTVASQWQASLTALNPRLVTVCLGTNDQPAMTPETFDTNMRTLIARIKAAVPSADVLIIMPCENGRANTYAMSLYAAYAYKIAANLKCAWLDLQYLFGDSYSEYSSSSSRPWFNADTIHPDPTTGGRAIASGLYRMMTTN